METSAFSETTAPGSGATPAAGNVAAAHLSHITVCIPTYKRPQLLARLLRELNHQETDGRFNFSVVVADNDITRTAEPVVIEFAATSRTAVRYCVQPEQNISLTRNMAIANAIGDYLAFIDDDEFPVKRWLADLYESCQKYGTDGVLGPVRRHFDVEPPQWVRDSQFYDRKTHPTGTLVDRKEARSGNVLLKRSVVADMDPVFRPEFRGGEDTDFFSRVIARGCKFVWCDEAVAFEVIPPARWNRKFLLKRALLRGAMTLKYQGFGPHEILKSAVAVPLYTFALPFTLLLGQHRFMDLLVRLCDHLGKLLAVMKLNPIKEHYVTD